MFSDRKSSIPLTDPYTALPRAPRDRSASAHPRETARLRSASVSMVAGNTPHASEASKRHTHHALQSQSPVGRNRIASLPAAQLETFSRGRSSIPMPSRPSKINNPIRLSIGDKPLPGHPRRLENLDPKALLRTLNSLLGPKSQRIPDYLDVDYLMALHERDLMEREQRDAIQLKARTDRAQGNASCSGLTVFGSSLREATMYASNGTVLGGYEHDIPIAVFRCVQELCRYGFHKPTPPRQPKPDRDRLLALISAFDSEPQFGLRTSFDCPSELREIYALLTTYLFALPDPILSSEMFEALWAWCVLPSLRSTEFLENDGRSRRHVATDSGVRIAQHLLHLLPLPNFSLIVYMMGFFQRLPHLITEDVGRAVFAGRCAKPASSTDGRAERSETMARWFLDRWDGIFKGLFAPPEIHQMEDVAPRSSNPWSPCDSSRDRFGSSQFVSSPLEIADEGTPRVAQEDPPADKRAPLLRLPSDGLFQSAVGAESDASSVSSSPALGERLLDLTLEFAEDAQLDLEKKRTKRYAVCPVRLEAAPDIVSDIASVSDDSGYQSPGDDALPCPHPPEEVEGELSYRAALRRISLLERELERSDVAVSDAISETFRARDQVKELEGKLKEAGKHPPVLDLRLDARAMDEEARKERDAALRLVEEVKKLMGGGRAF